MIHALRDGELRQRKQTRPKVLPPNLVRYKKLIEAKKSAGCSLCGTLERLVFHHTKPDNKKFEILEAPVGVTRTQLVAELDKCEILCTSCNARVHKLMTKVNKREVSYEAVDFGNDPNALAKIISKLGLKVSKT